MCPGINLTWDWEPATLVITCAECGQTFGELQPPSVAQHPASPANHSSTNGPSTASPSETSTPTTSGMQTHGHNDTPRDTARNTRSPVHPSWGGFGPPRPPLPPSGGRSNPLPRPRPWPRPTHPHPRRTSLLHGLVRQTPSARVIEPTATLRAATLGVVRTTARALVAFGAPLRVVDAGLTRGGGGGAGWRPVSPPVRATALREGGLASGAVARGGGVGSTVALTLTL